MKWSFYICDILRVSSVIRNNRIYRFIGFSISSISGDLRLSGDSWMHWINCGFDGIN